MWNYLIDGFPTEYHGYKIRTDFRVGVLLSLLMEDTSIDDDTKLLRAFDILYVDEVPEPDVAYSGLTWFLSCGRSELVVENEYTDDDVSNEKTLDFDIDSLDIWGGFWSKGVDLETTKMHWFKFMTALSNLGDIPISQKMGYRSMTLKGMSGEMKKSYEKLKNKYKIRRTYTKEEYDSLSIEDKFCDGKDISTLSPYEQEYIRRLQENERNASRTKW